MSRIPGIFSLISCSSNKKRFGASAIMAIFLLAPVAAHSGVTARLSEFAVKSPQRAIIPIAQSANGRNVVQVRTATGKFKMGKNGRWVERGNDGKVFRFQETHRDDWSVYLVDQSRNMRLQIDLHRKLILFAVGNEPMQPLYNITKAFAGNAGGGGKIGKAASSSIVEYSCNEGIPLVVRYENIGNKSRAFFSHDGFPEIKLKQVRSGSGVMYSNGRYTLHTKGRDAVLSWDGTTDVCRQR